MAILATGCQKEQGLDYPELINYGTIHAELIDGPTFNKSIPANATSIVFCCYYQYTDETLQVLLSSPSSLAPIYGHLNGSVWYVTTPACAFEANPNSGELFRGCSKLTFIDFGKNFSTSNVTDMHGMFQGCSKLTNLDLSSFNTSNVTDMCRMFEGCKNLTSLNLSSFNTSNVTDMRGMFQGCSNLTNLDLSSLNTSNVNNMAAMFKWCSGLTSLDVSSFNTSNVTDMHELFRGCNKLTSLNVSSFNTSHVQRMDAMFYGCSGLTSLDVSNFNTSNVVLMTRTVDTVLDYYTGYSGGQEVQIARNNELFRFGMFAQCSSLTSLDLSSFNTSKVTDMRGLFEGCKNLTNLNVSSFNTSNVKYMDAMFRDCRNLTSLDLSNFNTSQVVSMGDVHRFFYNSGSAGQYGDHRYLTNGGMFENCTSLSSLDLSNFYTPNVARMYNMFYNCTHLTYLNLSNFDMSHLEDIDYDYHFAGKDDMCYHLSTASGNCTIVCTESVQNSLLEYDGHFYITRIPVSTVNFTWVRP